MNPDRRPDESQVLQGKDASSKDGVMSALPDSLQGGGRVAIRSKRKYCTDCRMLKSVDEFYTRKGKRRDGTLVLYPTTYCIPCTKTRTGYVNRQRKARRIGSPQCPT